MELLYGTTNSAKLSMMRGWMQPLGIVLTGLAELGQPVPQAEEDGETPLDNARSKAWAYFRAFHRPVFSCDSGLYCKELPDALQPGVRVRRAGGDWMDDAQMTGYYSGLARQYGRLTARYQNAICLIWDENTVFERMTDDLCGAAFYLVETTHVKRVPGFPLDCLSVDIATGQYYYDLAQQDADDSAMEQGFVRFFREFAEKCLK